MTESARKVSAALTLFMAVLIGTTALVAQATREQIVENQADEDRALIITEKHFDEQTGKLEVKLLNTSEHFSVTAFGIMMVVADQAGEAYPRVNGQDTIPGNGAIAPGGSYDLVVNFEPQGEQKFRARTVNVHFEILSDTTSSGNKFLINERFRSRAHHAVELERTLERLRERKTANDTKQSAREFLQGEASHRSQSRKRLFDPHDRVQAEERHRLAAIGSIARKANQFVAELEEGRSPGETLSAFRESLEWEYHRYLEHSRPEDIRTILEAEIAIDE